MARGEGVGEEVAAERVHDQRLVQHGPLPARVAGQRQRLLVELLPGCTIRRREVGGVHLRHPEEGVRLRPPPLGDVLQGQLLVPLVRLAPRQPTLPLVADRVADLPQFARIGVQQRGGRGVEVSAHREEVADGQLDAAHQELPAAEELVLPDVRGEVAAAQRLPERGPLRGTQELLELDQSGVAEGLVLGRFETVDGVCLALGHVHQLVGEQVPPLQGVRSVLALAEDDVPSGRVGRRPHGPRGACRHRAGVDPHPGEVGVQMRGEPGAAHQRAGPCPCLAFLGRAPFGDACHGPAEDFSPLVAAHGKRGLKWGTRETGSPWAGTYASGAYR